jgi:hypothetical protein
MKYRGVKSKFSRESSIEHEQWKRHCSGLRICTTLSERNSRLYGALIVPRGVLRGCPNDRRPTADWRRTRAGDGIRAFWFTNYLASIRACRSRVGVIEEPLHEQRVRDQDDLLVLRPDSRDQGDGHVLAHAGMARLFGWRDVSAAPQGSRFVVSWRAPLTRRDHPGKPD